MTISSPSFTVAVGSSNPSKIRSVQQALEQIITAVPLVLRGYNVESGVKEQPYGDYETTRGAKNRARAAFEAYIQDHNGVEPHLSVGLEGGLEEVRHVSPNGNDGDDGEISILTTSHEGSSLACMAWMAVYGKRTAQVLQWTSPVPPVSDMSDTCSWGVAKTGTFILPPKITQLLRDEGMELSDADDLIFSRTKSKHGSGTVGILTNGLIDRSKYYEHALILALVPWIRHDVYP